MKNTLMWLLVAVMTAYSIYGLFIIPILRQKKIQADKAKIEEFQNNLKKSDTVLTISGMYGTIVAINENIISLEIAQKVIVKMDKSAIVGVTKKI